MQLEQTSNEKDDDPYFIIEELNTKVKVLEKQNEDLLKMLNQFRSAMCGQLIEADFYKLIQEMTKEHPTMKEQGRDLVMTMQLIDPEIGIKFKEILEKDRNWEMNSYVEKYESDQKFSQLKQKHNI